MNDIAVQGEYTTEVVESFPIAENYLPEKASGYKETELYWLDDGCMVTTNSDIPLDENVRTALMAVKLFGRNHKVDLLLEKFAQGIDNTFQMCYNNNVVNTTVSDHENSITLFTTMCVVGTFTSHIYKCVC